MKRALLIIALIVATPTVAKEDKASVDAWFARYDELTKKGDVEGMADMADFPIHVITNDSKGEGYAEAWSRDKFLAVMRASLAGTPKDLTMTATRQVFFLNDDLVTVITDAKVFTGKQTTAMRYADILIKRKGVWKFQTMAQAGWGDLLKTPPVAPAHK